MQQEIITAIDFGSEKLSASVVRNAKDKGIQILSTKSSKSKGFEKGILVDVNECREAVKSLLKNLEEKIKEEIYEVSIGISSRKIKMIDKVLQVKISDGRITNKNIRDTLENYKYNEEIKSDECIIDRFVNNVIVDGHIMYDDVFEMNCKSAQINITLVLADINEISKYYEVFVNTKYKIKYVIPNILAGKQVFLSNDELIDGDCALIDVGGGETDIAIFNNVGMPVYIKAIPLGGNNISNDLSICAELTLEEANELKKANSATYKTLCDDVNNDEDEISFDNKKISKKLFFEVINLRIQEILSHINMELKNTGHYDRICSIILYGDGVSYFEDIKELVGSIFNTRTKVVTGSELGMKNSENITSLALVKEVYDRLNLLGYNNNDNASNNKDIEQLKVDETESLHYNENENPIIKKVKKFFDKIF